MCTHVLHLYIHDMPQYSNGHVCMYECACVCVHTCFFPIDMPQYANWQVCMYECVSVYVYTRASSLYICRNILIDRYACMNVYLYMCTHVLHHCIYAAVFEWTIMQYECECVYDAHMLRHYLYGGTFRCSQQIHVWYQTQRLRIHIHIHTHWRTYAYRQMDI